MQILLIRLSLKNTFQILFIRARLDRLQVLRSKTYSKLKRVKDSLFGLAWTERR